MKSLIQQATNKVAQKHFKISNLVDDSKWPPGYLYHIFAKELNNALRAAYRAGQRSKKDE